MANTNLISSIPEDVHEDLYKELKAKFEKKKPEEVSPEMKAYLADKKLISNVVDKIIN